MDSPLLAHPHDRLARHFLTRTELAADLIGNYLDPGLAERLDLARLNCLSPVTVDGELGERAGDLRFSTFFKGGGLKSKVFLLLEHQSRSERHISFRIAEYVIKDFRERLNAKESPGQGGKNFPFPLAIILHHGKTPWKGPLKMRDLVDGARELAPFLLDLPIFLVDLASIPEGEIRGKPTLRALLAALQAAGKGRLAERFGRILGFLAGSGRDSRLRGDLRTLINYLAVVDRPRLAEADIRRELDKLIGSKEAEEMTTSLAREWLREGEAKGRAEGEAEGEAKGRAEALILVLRARFGDPPAAVRNKLRKCADPGQLDRWAELAATCPSLGDFRKKL